MPESTATRRQPQTSDALRDDVRAAISNAYYDARNAGRTMEHAADDAADRVMACLPIKADVHELTMEVQDAPRMFRAACSCGRYTGPWKTTNACMGGGRRHVAAMRRKAGA